MFERPPPRTRPLKGFGGLHAFWDEARHAWTVQILPGDYYVTRNDEVLTTVLGSCVSACIHDAEAGIGGMNHFMLPEAPSSEAAELSSRYGSFALTRLVRSLLEHGAQRERLHVAIYGGGKVISGPSDVGAANVGFVRRFLEAQKLPIHAEDVGATCARRVRYHPLRGISRVERIEMHDVAPVVDAERVHAGQINQFLTGAPPRSSRRP